MGWASGSDLFDSVIQSAMRYIPDKEFRKAFYKELIEAFEDADWDTESECCGVDGAFDEALQELHSEW
jgi:heterodisulfide reductase subunit B